MKKLVLVLLLLLLLAGLQGSQLAVAGYARVTNLTIDVWLTGGDWEAGPYPYWRRIAPSTYGGPYYITPEPVTGATPYITCGIDAGKFWANFDNATSAGSVASNRVLGLYEVSRIRASFDYRWVGLTPPLQLQVKVNRGPYTALVWHSSNAYYQTGHVEIERDVAPHYYANFEVALAPPVPEPSSLLVLGFGISGLGTFALSRRRR